jgi:hypothetical protein
MVSNQRYLYFDQLAIGFLNQKILSPFFNATIGNMVTKSYKVSINALVFICSKFVEIIITKSYSLALKVLKDESNLELAQYF